MHDALPLRATAERQHTTCLCRCDGARPREEPIGWGNSYQRRLRLFATTVQGSGYFDVRGKQDDWIRIACKKGDMILLPEVHYYCCTARMMHAVQETIKEQNFVVLPHHLCVSAQSSNRGSGTKCATKTCV